MIQVKVGAMALSPQCSGCGDRCVGVFAGRRLQEFVLAIFDVSGILKVFQMVFVLVWADCDFAFDHRFDLRERGFQGPGRMDFRR